MLTTIVGITRSENIQSEQNFSEYGVAVMRARLCQPPRDATTRLGVAIGDD